MTTRALLRRARKAAGRLPLVRRLRDDLDLLVKYGSFRPERVPLADSTSVIFANPREPRGLAILRGYGAGQPALKRIWRGAIAKLQPNVVLDVGANYGEFLFFTAYPADAIVIGIEADPKLVTYLERSRLLHPHADRIEVVSALAAEAPGEPVPFYVDERWSGRSSALQQERHASTHVEMVPKTSIDELLGARLDADSRLVFKIDVEGFEPHVLAGMTRTLSTASQVLGIMEFNTSFLRKLGVDPEAYVGGLRERFVLRLVEGDTVRDLSHGSVEQTLGGRDVAADIVLATSKDLLPPHLA